eukprot:15458266-Alexandrium_andersonii.AAC.1
MLIHVVLSILKIRLGGKQIHPSSHASPARDSARTATIPAPHAPTESDSSPAPLRNTTSCLLAWAWRTVVTQSGNSCGEARGAHLTCCSLRRRRFAAVSTVATPAIPQLRSVCKAAVPRLMLSAAVTRLSLAHPLALNE